MKRALLVIDVQNEYFEGKLPVTYPPETLKNILKAMDAAAIYGIPIVVVQHTSPQKNSATFVRESESWNLRPEVTSRPYNHLVEKNLPGCFTNTDLELWLRDRNIDTVVISGYMTQMCCDTAARQAFHLGFSVEFLSDATGTLSISNKSGTVSGEELHRAILVTQEAKFSKVIDTEEWINNIKLDT